MTQMTQTVAPRDRDTAKLREELEPWIFFLPTAGDSLLAARGELGLNCEMYDYVPVSRGDLWDRPALVVAGDGPDGAKRAEECARACRQKKAKPVRIWTLPGLGTEHPTLESWCGAAGIRRFELALAFEAPWKGRGRNREEKEPAPTQADILVRLGQQLGMFKTPDGETYATLKVRGHLEHHPIASQVVEDWLRLRFEDETGKTPSAESLAGRIKSLQARAREEAPTATAWIRVGMDADRPPSDPTYYLDLGDEERRAVRITAEGWRVVVEDLPVRFRRPRGMLPLPVPVEDAPLDRLWDYLNLADESERLLAIASLTADFLPQGPYPVKVISGEQGSAKSTTTKLLKRLVDPASSALRSAPKEVRDLMIAAKNTWVMAFDNLSDLPDWLSDALARIATGGGFATRKMYSDDEEALFDACRPIILNSIEEIATRADLLDRAVIFNCPAIPDEKRREEREFWRAFERAYPAILGALLDAVAGGIRMLPAVVLTGRPRMADFARWGEAVCQGLGYEEGDFLAAYAANRNDAAAAILEESPVAAELMAMRQAWRGLNPGQPWRGTMTALLNHLREQATAEAKGDKEWPRNARSLSCHLRRLAPALRKVGIDVRLHGSRTATARAIHINFHALPDPPRPVSENATGPPRVGDFASLASLPSSEGEDGPPDPTTQDDGLLEVPF